MPQALGDPPAARVKYEVLGQAPYTYVVGGPPVTTPLKLEGFRELSKDYPKHLRDFLLGVVEYGYAVVPPDSVETIGSYMAQNYASLFEGKAYDCASDTFRAELLADKIMIVPLQPRCVSARGATPKRDYTQLDGRSLDKFRLITDLKRPIGRALNEFTTAPSFKYARVDEAILLSSYGCWYVKIDLKAAYRHIALHPETWTLFGFAWDGNWVVDKFLPFGLRPACWLFSQFTRFICWVCRQKGIKAIIGYLDDFLIIAATREDAARAEVILRGVLAKLGFEIAADKCEGPSQVVTFLGMVLNSITCEVSLPEARHKFIKQLVLNYRNCKECTVKEMQQLVGFLGYASRVVYGGRTFTRRLIEVLTEATRLGRRFVRWSAQTRLDIQWWCDCLDTWMGKALFIKQSPTMIQDFQIDASGNERLGAGAFWNGSGIQQRWDEEVAAGIRAGELNSPHLEVFPLLMAARKWHEQWKGKHVIVFTDNKGAQFYINSGTSPHKMVMRWLRELFWLSAVHGFRVTARWIPGKINKIADALSRFEDEDYLRYKLLWRQAKNGLSKVFETEPWLHAMFFEYAHKLVPTLESEDDDANAAMLANAVVLVVSVLLSRFSASHFGVYVMLTCCLGATAEQVEQLKQRTIETWSAALAKNYQASLNSSQKTFLVWCAFYNLVAVPATEATMMLYVRSLADSKLQYATIKNYINGVRNLHKQFNCEAPAYRDNYHYNRVMTAIRREIGGDAKQKLHITPQLLLAIHEKVNWKDTNERMFFAASLLAFYTLFRKSNFTTRTQKEYDARKNLSRGDVAFPIAGLMVVQSTWSKTNQFQDRTMTFPVVASPCQALDAIYHVQRYFADDPAGGDDPCF